ncbi:bifunctional riboflavin kinase/FAD synthetase [Vallitalea okinawensis]|uniref:bifunctional riboflavin kinase/FAD synthetase n=1 Tax=Vallitalea okinawensis TaxID=2078660 RepID=UPI000CFB5B14|nr:bifunctional riboflavin kinase/FAD synthetase [Vallitalea okinawensis]
MEYIHKAAEDMHISKGTVIALGNFDGIHVGHRRLITTCKDRAKEKGYSSLVFSFYPHPSHVLEGMVPVPIIYTRDEKKRIVESMEVDYYVEYPFNLETAQMEPITFIKEVLVAKLRVRMIIVGSNYRFGHKRQGDIHLLRELSQVYGYELVVIDDIIHEDHMVSSTEIRKLIADGRIDEVNQLLTRPYFIIGEVVYGKQLGRKLGFPTMNIRPNVHKQYPALGVYVTRTFIGDKVYKSVTNVGHNPTVTSEQKLNVETYILDFEDQIYGKQVTLEFQKRLRDELSFQSLDELILQMKNDVKLTRDYFEKREEIK